MVADRVDEVEERVARLTASGNGASSRALDPDDLDWVLFHSFPGSEVAPGRLASLLPVYERALGAGAVFDYELLYVRLLEAGDAVAADARASIAKVAAERALGGGFDAADSIAAIRFVLRVLPGSDFLDRLLGDPSCERLRFHLVLDFTLDERELDDYLAVSYLREGDPDADPVLARFPVPAAARERLVVFLAEDKRRRLLADGLTKWTEPEERATLFQALAERLPDR